MKLELTMQEYEDLLTCTAVGVIKAREWVCNVEQDELARNEDLEYYYDLLKRITELNDKVRTINPLWR